MTRTSALLRFAALVCMLPVAASSQDAAKPVHGYRLTYTLTTTEAGKRVGSETFAMTVNTAPMVFQNGKTYTGRGTVKIGEKIPIATGTDTKNETTFSYLDIGINIDATLTEAPTGLLLATKVEQSSVAPEPVVISGVSEPLIRQVVVENSSTAQAGKSVRVGSLDLPDSNRHVDIEVMIDALP